MVKANNMNKTIYHFILYNGGEITDYEGECVCISNKHIKEWWCKRKRHRVDKPAIEYADGTKIWWFHGELHRDNGPAIEWAGGENEWCNNGRYLEYKSRGIGG